MMTERPASLRLGLGLGCAAMGAALLLGYVLTHESPAIALALVLVPPIGLLLVLQPRAGLYLAIIGILALPYWYTVGSAQAPVFRIVSVLGLVVWIRARRPRMQAADWMLALLVLAMALSLVFQDDQHGAARILINELLPVCFYVAARGIDPTHERAVLRTIAIGGALGALTVVYEYHAGHVIFLNPNDYSWNASDSTIFRPGGIYGSPPGASTVLAVTALCGLPLVRDASGWRRWGWTLCVGLCVVAAFLTFTRASLIGLAIGLVIYLWLSRSRLLSPLLIMTLAVVTTFAVVLVLPKVSQSTGFQQSFVRTGDLAARESYWQLALPIVDSSPSRMMFGLGAEMAEVVRLNGTAPAALAAAPVLVKHGTHNQYVLTLLEQGLVGAALLVAWLAAVIRHGLRAARGGRSASAAALTASVVALAIIMLANNALLHPPSFAVLALAAGLLVNHRDSWSRGMTPPG